MIKNKTIINFLSQPMQFSSLSACSATPPRLLLLCLLLSVAVGLQPVGPIIASPNTESSPSNFIFTFQLDRALLSSSYLMVVMPIFPSIITPFSCTLLGNSPLVTACVNLFNASLSTPKLTINSTAVSAINPNIQINNTIVVGFSSLLASGVAYSLQIVLSNNLPSIGALSSSFEMYAISGTGVMQEENWNMGQVFFQLRNNNLMSIVSINAETANRPGTTVSDLLIDVTVGVACPTPLSTFVFTISGNFQFTVSSLVSTLQVSDTPPQILSMTVVSPNIIRVIFNEQFAVGRRFQVSISNIYNPLEISSGAVSLYNLPYNSISPLEVKELSIPFQTVAYPAAVNIYTAEGIAPSAPMEFYLSTIQYITVTVLLPRNFDPSFILQLSSDAFQIQEGTIFARTSTVNTNTLVYKLVDLQTAQISGFSTIPSGSVITITLRVWINTNPIFNVYVKIDTEKHLNDSAPIIQGTASATVSALPETFIASFTGSGAETNKLTAMQTTTSSISFSVTPLFQTFSGSYLQIYTSSNLIVDSTFSGATSCLINGTAQPCTIVTLPSYTTITIASSSSFNLYPQSMTTTVQINQLKFNYASSHSLYLFHFYFQLTVSLASQATVKKYLVSPMVVQERNQLTNFKNYFSNNLYNTGGNFLNVIRLVSPAPAEWTNIIQVNQRRIISVFAYQGWNSLFTTLTSYSPYPCLSNLQATYTFIKGSNALNLTTDFPLNWDRINIVLPGTESSTKFSIAIPTQYLTTSAVLFEIMVGFVDINNGAVTYLHSQPLPVAAAPTYLLPTNLAVYTKPKQATMQLNIAGLAGSYRSSVTFTVAPSATFSGTTYSTALIVMSSWQFYDSLTTLSAASLASTNPQFANIEQTPLCLQISSSSFLTYIPFTTTAIYSSSFNITFDNIKLPYNLDLPYYSVSLIDDGGSLDGYNEFINQNQNSFYTGVLKELAVSCNDNSLAVTNTYCTVTFTPFQDIEVASVLTLNLFGIFVSTNLCAMRYAATNVSVPVASCTPNTNLTALSLKLANPTRLPALSSYAVVVNGMSIDPLAVLNYVQVQVMDPTGSYAIEQKTVQLLTSVEQNFPIYITQVSIAFNNPVVTSSLFVNFTLPRPLNNDESFALTLSKDFTNLNSIPCKMRIRLMQADGLTEIPTQWILKFINSQIIFEGLQSSLAASSYSLEMYGIITPSTVTQDMLGIIYLRIYDNTYAKTNTVASTAIFPSLVAKVNSLITLQTYYNTEGLEQEMTFTVINQFVIVNQDTIWILNLPRYYSPNVWNEDYLIYCTISGTPLTCARSPYTPYQLVLSASPRIIEIGETYSITLYGIPCPRAAYLNGNTMFVTENIFFAMATSSSATSYSDYSQLFISNSIISPQSAGYGAVTLLGVSSSNMYVYQTTFFTINVSCTVAIGVGNWIYVTFPKEFNNFNNIPVTVQTQFSATDFEVSASSTVINFRIGYKLNSLAIPAGTQFQIMITSLLTPKVTTTINMNSLRVMVASSDRISTIASSVESRNQLGTLTFQPNLLHLVVNSYNPIQITAGTYCTPIKISSSDNLTFLTNMMITFSSTQLSFLSNPTYMYLGSSYSSFIIGAGQNLIPTTYSFNMVKKETSISAYYSTLSEYAVSVNSIPVTIAFPTALTVPIGGCSIPALVQLANPPYSSLQINFEYDTVAVPPNQFWVNQQMSYEHMSFDLNNTKRWISFCSNYTMPASSFTVATKLGGDNAASYKVSTTATTINVVASPALNATPTFTLTIPNVQKTFVSVQMQTNVPGFFFYHLKLAPLNTPLSLDAIKSDVKANTLLLETNNDYLTTKIYVGDRDTRVGYAPALIGGANYASLEDLLPERSYTICGYFQTQFGVSTTVRCASFTMQSWGTVSKAYISFSTPILANQLNNVLCFFVKASSSKITQIVDLQGNSCSLNTSPQNYNYDYNGNTTTNELTSTIVYHMANPNLTTDASISAFNALFDLNGITTASKTLAQTQFSINYIASSYALTSFSPMTAIQSSSTWFQPSLSLTIQPYSKGSFKAYVTGIQLNVPGAIYFILVSYKNITTNQITSQTKISIKTLVTPSSDQIASCTDGSGYPAVQCMRVMAQSGKTYSLTLPNMVENSVYALYYVIANEYPLRPVFYGGVSTQYIMTTVWEGWLVLAGLLLVAFLPL